MLIRHGKRGFALERSIASNGLVEDTTQRIHIRTCVRILAAGLLRRQVLRGTNHGRSLRHRRGGIIQRAGDAEVHHLHHSGVGEHNIRRFDIAVDDPSIVAGLQSRTHRLQNLGGFVRAHRPVVTQQIPQRRTVNTLHDNVRNADTINGFLAGVVDRHDIWVVQLRRVAGFATEALTEVHIPRHFGTQHLHRYIAAQQRILRRVHVGHAAAADDLA